MVERSYPEAALIMGYSAMEFRSVKNIWNGLVVTLSAIFSVRVSYCDIPRLWFLFLINNVRKLLFGREYVEH